ncbi:MAG: hypothetical protein HW380_3263 [Magnetococcales bacterium]|nr:hypothetical protein [Magnetococcales bacterium]
MGLFHDSDAIQTLSEHIKDSEAGASSHWLEMHRDFSFHQGKLAGIKGFGTYQLLRAGSKSYVQRVAHVFFQRRFRAMGSSLPPFLKVDRVGYEISARQNQQYGLDRLRQVLTLSLLLDRIPHAFADDRATLVIGDGFGMLSALLLATSATRKVVVVNLTKTLLVDMIFIRMALPDVGVALATSQAGFDRGMGDARVSVVALRSDDYSFFQSAKIGVAVNVASMQEMNPPTIANYFSALRQVSGRELFFYCCNREEKRLPDGTNVRFSDYPWSVDDGVLLDEPCPWHQEFYQLGWPIFRPYDGPIRHRLALLSRKAIV